MKPSMANAFTRLFIPHPHNNHKAKILSPQYLVILLGLFILGRSTIDIYSALNPGVLGYASSINPDKVIELTNVERQKQGSGPVTYNSQLAAAAMAKAHDMYANNYWAHVSPTGTEPWYFITKAGYKYLHAGENLARDFRNPQDVVAAWMASPTHKQNLLDSRYKDIGVAVLDGTINGVDTTLVVQMFGTTQEGVPAVADTGLVTTVLASDTNQKLPIVSPLEISRIWSLTFIVLVLLALFMDWLFVWRYNLIRVSGKTWAHITFFASLALILFVIRQGIIL